MTSDARESGLRRLAEAVHERSGGRALRGSARHGEAAGRLCGLRGADDQVSARQAWLEASREGFSRRPAGLPRPRRHSELVAFIKSC